MNTDSQVAINSLMEGIAQYVDYKVSTTPYVKTEMGKIVSSTLTDGKWLHKVAIRNMEYNDIKSVGNLKFNNNSIVYLFIPNGQYNNMFILGQLDNTDVNIKGGNISIGNGNFTVDSNGNMTAKTGYIGNGSNGFTISTNSIYKNKNSLSSNNDGVYIGTNGIAFGNSTTQSGESKNNNIKLTSEGLNYVNKTTFGTQNIESSTNFNITGLTSEIIYSNTGSSTPYSTSYCEIGADCFHIGNTGNDRTYIPYYSITLNPLQDSHNLEIINLDLDLDGSLSVSGLKNRVVKTDTYGKRALNAVESAEAYFSDLGTIKCNEEGLGIVIFEDIFSETVDLNKDYNVQITQLTEYNGWVEKQKDKFIIHSNPNAEFDWVVYCKQKDYSDIRLEKKGD